MNSQSKIMELVRDDHEMADLGANAEAKVRAEQLHLEPGSEAFYAEVLAIMEESGQV